MELYIHSPIHLHGMDSINFTCTVPSSMHFKHKLYSSMAGFLYYHKGLGFGFHFSDRNFSDALQTCRKGLQGRSHRYKFSMLTQLVHLTYLPILAIVILITVTRNTCHSLSVWFQLHKISLRSKMKVNIFALY